MILNTHIFKSTRKLSIYSKILFTILILIGYRVLTHVPLPFVNSEYIKALLATNAGLSFFNVFTGGAFEEMSLMALGITPYITASIVIQLMGVVIPRLSDLQKEGAVGQKIIEKITLILAAILGFAQALTMCWGYGAQGLLNPYTWYTVLIPALLITGGVFLLSFAGQMITKHFFGNGISLLLLTGILSSYLSDAKTLFTSFFSGEPARHLQLFFFGKITSAVKTIDEKGMMLGIIASVVAVVIIFLLFMYSFYLNFCEKQIKVSYSQKANSYIGNTQTSIIPLKLLSGSVVPIIFASTILSIPTFIMSFTKVDIPALWIFDSTKWFSGQHIWATLGVLLYCAMIIGFSYYYNHLNLNETALAENLKKRGGYIHGIRPGKETEKYLRQQLKYMTFLGAVGLCVIAIVPLAITNVLGIPRLAFLGTSIIIVVSVLKETRQKFMVEYQSKSVWSTLHKSSHTKYSIFGSHRKGR